MTVSQLDRRRLGPGPTVFLTLCLTVPLGACENAAGSEEDEATASRSSPVVYGSDDRLDWYAQPDPSLRALTREAIVAMMEPEELDTSDPENIRILSPLLGDVARLCEDQRFRDQPTAADCSATLIDDDLVLTAAHCLPSRNRCGDARFVFRYYLEEPGLLARITHEDVFTCREVLVRTLRGGAEELDYAILRLDRPATPRHKPAPVKAWEEAVRIDDPVTVIGFGSGLPAKIDTGGRVLGARSRTLDYFLASTDTFGGNSGSGVFDAQGRVVGILVRGNEDYRRAGRCLKANVLPQSGGRQGGEGITYGFRAIQALCATEHRTERLCGEGALCGDGQCLGPEDLENCPEDCAPPAPVVPPEWTCDPAYYAAQDGCDCRCGAWEPDCDDDAQAVFGCASDEVCALDATCAVPAAPPLPGPPAGWTCPDAQYSANDGCHCGCGAWDPDCADLGQEILGCAEGGVCGWDGACRNAPDDGGAPDAGVGADAGGVSPVKRQGSDGGGGCSAVPGGAPTPAPGSLAAPFLALGALIAARRRRAR